MSMTFADLGVPHEFVSPLRKAGITTPFPIQAAAIPDALAGRDVLGKAPTGSGKTLAFGLPLLTHVGRADPRRPEALVLSPTRELAEQIRRELAPIAAGRGRRLLTVYGGVPYHPQQTKLRRGVDVLIACPGRLIDLVEQGDLTLSAVTYVVIDEADRMADMGFIPQVRQLLDLTPPDRQTLMFSATLDGDVAGLTRRYQRDPVKHEVGEDANNAGDAEHHFWRVERNDRATHVADVASAFDSTLVFTRTRRGADRLAQNLSREGVPAAIIHGGRSQKQRDRALRDFSRGHVATLVATDVAARGIHVDGVDCVVHYDPPDDHKAYLHRSGRTARAGADGTVVSLVTQDQVRAARRMQRRLGLSEDVGEVAIGALLGDSVSGVGSPFRKEPDRKKRTSRKAGRPKSAAKKAGRAGSSRNGRNRKAGRATSGKSSGGRPKAKKRSKGSQYSSRSSSRRRG